MNEHLYQVAKQFQLLAEPSSIEPYGDGHINDTYLVITPKRRYIMQRLNKFVFKRPDYVMENIKRVTEYLAEQIRQNGGDPERETLTVVDSLVGDAYYLDELGDYFRVYLFVEDTISVNLPDTPELFERSGYSFGKFQQQLEGFPAEQLHETIANFHNTADRFNNLVIAIEENRAGRKDAVADEIAFAMQYQDEVRALIDANLPLRVTHNDTKLNNILMDDKTGVGLCVIDLDTVMPGLAAYDFGDSIRFGANTALEDETDLSKVTCSLEMFEAFARGYLQAAGKALTDSEIELLPMGAKLMTLECGMRFLTDHLNGDIYFKVHRENHNLDRARNQFALVKDMEKKWTELQAIIAKQKEA